MKRLDIVDSDRVLIIAPHPDDESIGVGGVLSLYPSRCDIWCVTDGGSNEIMEDQEAVSRIRMGELDSVVKSLKNNSVQLFKYPNGELIQSPDCFDACDLGIYTKIFIPHGSEAHSDHRAVFGFFVNKYKSMEGDKPEVYQYETRMPIDVATHYLDITEVIDKKLSMIGKYQSQCRQYDYVSFAKSLAKFNACRQNAPERYYENYTQLVITDDMESDDLQAKLIADYRRRNDYLEAWLDLESNGKSPADTIAKKYRSVAIYGYGYFGRMLCRKMKTKGIEIRCVLDRNAGNLCNETLDIRIPDYYDDIETVIISNITGINKIKDDLRDTGYKSVETLWDLLIEAK